MPAPKIILSDYISGEVVKLTTDQHFDLEFDLLDVDYECRVWTNWSTGKWHKETASISKIDNKLHYNVTLLCDNTGFFRLEIHYRKKKTLKWMVSDQMIRLHVDPDWIYDAIVYNVFLRAFSKTKKDQINPGEGGTFTDVIKHMDEFVELGINVLYLNPFQLIGELERKYNPHNHIPYYLQPGSPYSIRDFKSIDPEVAFSQKDPSQFIKDPNKQFRKLVDAAHKRGIRVIMDLVFNHTAHDFILQRIYPEWFLYKQNPTSIDDPFLYPEDLVDGKPWGDARYSVPPFDHGEFGWTDTAKLNWEYNSPPAPNLPPKNKTIKEMYEYFKSIPKYWIKEFGIDGFRTDIAYSIPIKFWRECIRESRLYAKRQFPHNGSIDGELIFIGETWEDKLKELFEAGFSYLYGSYSYKIFNPQTLKGYLDWIYNVNSHDFPKNSKWFIFPECHDFDRATSRLIPHHLIDAKDLNHDEIEEMTIRSSKSRWVLTATLPGMPMVFMGFEKLEWQQIDHVSYSKINWEGEKDINKIISEINAIRHSYIALQKGSYLYLNNSQGMNKNTQIFSFARFTDNQIIFIIVNMDFKNKAIANIYLPKINTFNPNKPYILKDLIDGKIYQSDKDSLYVELKPGRSHIFLVEQNWG